MNRTVNIQIRAKEWLRNMWDDLFDRSKHHSKGELFESVVQLYKRAQETGNKDMLEDMQETIQTMEGVISSEEQKNHALKEECSEKDERIRLLEIDLEEALENGVDLPELERKYEIAASRIRALESEAEKLREQLNKVKQERDNAQAQLDEAAEHDEIYGSKQDAENFISELVLKQKELTDEIQTEKQRADNAVKKYESIMDLVQPMFTKVKGKLTVIDGKQTRVTKPEQILEYLAENFEAEVES